MLGKENEMKAFITKYCLSIGIQEVDDAEHDQKFTSMISVPSLGPFANFHGEGMEWHRTYEAAVAMAHKIRLRKIASLKKSIAKLEALTWSKPK